MSCDVCGVTRLAVCQEFGFDEATFCQQSQGYAVLITRQQHKIHISDFMMFDHTTLVPHEGSYFPAVHVTENVSAGSVLWCLVVFYHMPDCVTGAKVPCRAGSSFQFSLSRSLTLVRFHSSYCICFYCGNFLINLQMVQME